MPPPKNALSRNFSRNTNGLFTNAGHGRLLVIGDSSLDVPDNAQVAYYLGNKRGDISAAAAFTEISDAYAIDEDVSVRFMLPDRGRVADKPAPVRNQTVIGELGFNAVGLVKDGKGGFYEFAKGSDPTKLPIYCLTASDFAYDCIAATFGHSQI